MKVKEIKGFPKEKVARHTAPNYYQSKGFNKARKLIGELEIPKDPIRCPKCNCQRFYGRTKKEMICMVCHSVLKSGG